MICFIISPLPNQSIRLRSIRQRFVRIFGPALLEHEPLGLINGSEDLIGHPDAVAPNTGLLPEHPFLVWLCAHQHVLAGHCLSTKQIAYALQAGGVMPYRI